jgi:DNA-binding response OmpR family regulator
MPEAASPKRILFVDDEASIRLTLPPVLEEAGFDVHVAESVSDALFEINSRQFDVLISDLNIGEEGDGFLVTSAMRHVQPKCVTFILTGYPAFETALQAIHNHVDDYLVKPVEVASLVDTIKEKCDNRGSKPAFGVKRLSAVLKSNSGQIVNQVTQTIQDRAKGSVSPAAAIAISDHLVAMLRALGEQLALEQTEPNAEALRSAAEYGKERSQNKFVPSEIAVDFRYIEQEVYALALNHTTGMDVTTLLSDLRKFSLGLHLLMEKSLQQSFTKGSSRRAKG